MGNNSRSRNSFLKSADSIDIVYLRGKEKKVKLDKILLQPDVGRFVW